MSSFQGVRGGRRKATMIRNREEAMANLARQRFFDSDRVKEFHRKLMLSETLKERDEQVIQKQMIVENAKEENRRLMEHIRYTEMKAMEHEKQRANRQHLQRKSVAEIVKQQICEKELIKKHQKLDIQRQVKEWQVIREQYEKDMKMQRQKKHDKTMNTIKTYTDQITTRNTMRAKEAKQKEMEERRQRQQVMEKDNWTAMVRDIEAERQDGLQRRRDIVMEKLALKMQEDSLKNDQQAANALARALGQQEAKWLQAQKANNEKRKATIEAITAHREYKRRHHEQTTLEEKQRGWDTLQAKREENKFYLKNEQLIAKKKREDLRHLNDIRFMQITEKQAKVKLQKQEQLEFDFRNAQLIHEEDAQFQAYTAAIINAASASKKNTFGLHAAARMGMGYGVGPISGGLRGNYLVPGATNAKMVECTRSIQDITKFSRANDDLQSTKSRLGFA